MEDDLIHERYKELACAIVEQGINDWLRTGTDKYQLYYFLMHCPWIDYLKIDREYLYVKVLKLKKEQKRKRKPKEVKMVRYAKKEKS